MASLKITRPAEFRPGAADPREPACRDTGRGVDWVPGEAAHYIADLTAELAAIARGVKLDLVAYLLDVARLEASRNVQQVKSDGS
jgi:hypothetical protein